MKSNKKNRGLIILVLSIFVLVLLVTLAYFFAIKPAITGHIINAKGEGYQIAVLQLAELAKSCEEPIPVTVGDETIYLIGIHCLQN